MSQDDALKALKVASGSKYEPFIVEIFFKLYKEGALGWTLYIKK